MANSKYHRVTVDDNFPIIDFERLDFPEQSYLGRGGFATVARARHRDWKQDVAVKRLLDRMTEGSEQEQLYSEARKLNLGSRSDHVISLLGVCLDPNFAIVMPYMENGSLAGLLRDVDVPWALRWRMAHEISLGMTFLHCQNPQILHCDLKAENVLLDGDFHVKISDFGLSKWRTESRIVTGTSPTGATITHAPPEYITDINLVPTAKFDVYSFGVLLWEIITTRIPYENAINTALIELGVRTGQRPDMRLVPTDVPDMDTVSQLMQTCWSENPDDRPPFMECEDRLRAVKNKCRMETFHEAIIYIMKGKERRKRVEPIYQLRVDRRTTALSHMSGLQPKVGFKVEELKPKAGGRPVKGSSIPLILPNDMKYNAATGRVEKIPGAQRKTLHVVPEALDLLEGIEEPVSVISICGPCRSGKSYILSRLLGTADAFELGHYFHPQTFGIWMGTKVLRGKDFTIVLLDTEGIDAAGASTGQDASILVLTILLSSQLIYNSVNVPYKADLEKMQCFIKLATGVTVKQGTRTDVSDFHEFFPDFLWLLRDVSLKMEDEHGKEIDPTTYLKTKVLKQSDKVGRAILTFFPSLTCAILERPSGDTEVMINIAQHTDKLNPRFNKGVKELTERLVLKSRPKRGYDKDSTVSGVALSIMTKQYVEAVNDPNSIPALDNTWRNTVELMRNKAIEDEVMEYNKRMQGRIAKARATMNGEVPLEEDETLEETGDTANQLNIPRQPTLMDLHHASFEEVTDMFLGKVGHFGIGSESQGSHGRKVVERMQNRLVQREERTVDYVAANGTTQKNKRYVVTGGELFQYIQENKELSRTFCQETFERLFDPIRKHVDSPPPDYDFKQLLKELDNAHQKYYEQACGPEKWAVLQEMTKHLEQMKANFKKIKGYQKKVLQEQQKAQEAELKAKEQARELQQLRKQAEDMEKAHKETLQKMQQQHNEQMEKWKQREAEREAREEENIQELNALMEERARELLQLDKQAEYTAHEETLQKMQQQRNEHLRKKRNERESEKLMEMMEKMQQEQEASNREMMKLMDLIRKEPTAPPPRCTTS